MDTDVTYKRVSILVDKWLELHKDETFDLDTICRQLEISERENRHFVVQKLSYEVKAETLEKSNRLYRYINKEIKYIDWLDETMEATLNVKWPQGRDGTKFGFDGHACISPKDIIVVTGTSNMGKTAVCLNFLWENMDNYPCRLMGNEYAPAKFRRRVKRMDWKNPLDDNGKPKFELIERHENWKDIIEPDKFNIIDWLSLPGDKLYMVGNVIEGIQSKLRMGIALIVLQKDEDAKLGRGRGFSEELASLYLVIDKGRLTVRKAKEWYEHNPNFEMYGFEITGGGTEFRNIREIIKCSKCYGTGKYRGGECDCDNGFLDKEIKI